MTTDSRDADIYTLDCSDETHPNRWTAIMFAKQNNEGFALVNMIFRGNSEQQAGDKAEAWWQEQMAKLAKAKR